MATHTKQKKIKGNRPKLKVFRSSEPLKSVLMWGINYSHNALQHVRPHAVFVRDDFKSFMKIKVNNHNFDRENMPSKYKFKEYSPMVFQSLRKKLNISHEDYLESFTQSEPEWDSTVGRSGSKFMVTYNRHYVVKTINSDDLIQIQTILENYYAYIVQCAGDTLLPHYLGLYRITVSDQETYLLVMRNLFSPRLSINSKYDLKGTQIDREAKEKHKNKPCPTLKDMDFINELTKIDIGPESKAELMPKLRRDIQFLQDNNLTDYSILVGVHELDNPATYGVPGSPEAVIFSENTTVSVTSDTEELNERQSSTERDVSHQGYASAGDGIGGIIEMLKRKGISSEPQMGPTSIGFPGLPSNSNSCKDERRRSELKYYSRSQTTDDEDDDEMLSDPGHHFNSSSRIETEQLTITAKSKPQDVEIVSSPEQPKGNALGHLTPPESPPNGLLTIPFFNGEINKVYEFYGILSAQNASLRCIYFIGLIDILNQYGLRKKTAKTYKTVTMGHSADVGTVKPETYGSRLIDFINTHVV